MSDPAVTGVDRQALLCSLGDQLAGVAGFLAGAPVSVQLTTVDGAVLFLLRPARFDAVGKLIGAHGGIIKALRARLQEKAVRLGVRVCLDVEGADGGSRVRARGPA